MMDTLANAIRQQARLAMGDISQAHVYLVSSYDPNTYSVKVNVTFDPDATPTESGWMPLGAAGVGNGFGLCIGAVPGDQVVCVFPYGDFESGIVVARIFSTAATPPATPSGEAWLVHQSGSFFKLTNNGKATVSDKAGSTVVMNGDGTGTMAFASGLTIAANVQIDGNLVASGNVSDLNGAHGTLANARATFDGHNHPVNNIQTGTSSVTSGVPSQQE